MLSAGTSAFYFIKLSCEFPRADNHVIKRNISQTLTVLQSCIETSFHVSYFKAHEIVIQIYKPNIYIHFFLAL
jgi:hypothetical protein